MKKEEINAIKRYVGRRVKWMDCGEEICPSECWKKYKQAEAHLDSFAEEEKRDCGTGFVA